MLCPHCSKAALWPLAVMLIADCCGYVGRQQQKHFEAPSSPFSISIGKKAAHSDWFLLFKTVRPPLG